MEIDREDHRVEEVVQEAVDPVADDLAVDEDVVKLIQTRVLKI